MVESVKVLAVEKLNEVSVDDRKSRCNHVGKSEDEPVMVY